MDCAQLFVLLLLACCSERANAQGVQLVFQGETVVNHGYLLRGQIGTADGDTVMCVTDNTACCSGAETGGEALGDWFFPNGSRVQSNTGTQFYRTRGPQVVRLHRRSGGVAGIYHCWIPDASGENQDLYVGLYTSSTGRPHITSIQFTLTSELNAQTPTFTLTCISEGGPVEEVDWFTGGTPLQDGSIYDISGPTVVDNESAIYHHTLTVTGRLPDTYTCRVLSNRPVTAGGVHLDTRNIDVVAADPPTIVSADQVGTTTVRVTWTPPTGGATMTGYRIYYTGGFRDVGNGGANEDTFTLQNGAYTIAMVARSQHLPSVLSNSVMVTVVGDVTTVAPLITFVQSVSPTSIMVVWTQQGEVDSFEIAYERVTCPSVEDNGTVTVDGAARQQTVMELDEFSTYSFTITAMADGSMSLPSGSMTATTEQAAPSGAPEAVRAVAVTSTSITVAWDPVNCIDRNSEITHYTVCYGPESIPDDRETVTVPGSGDAGGMYAISPLTSFTNYSIQVAAVNNGSQSGEFSDAIIVVTEQDARVVDLVATPGIVSIAVSWSTSGGSFGDITAYEVYYQRQGEQERELRNITDTSMTSTELTGLRPETIYTISVRVYSIAGPGEEESIMVTTTSIPEVQNVEVVSITDTAVLVYWDSIEGVSYYRVYYSPTGSSSDMQRQDPADNEETIMPSAFIRNLTTGMEYQFRVAAVVEVDGETFSGERSQLDDSSRVVAGSSVTPAAGEEQSFTAAALAGSVVAGVILTVLLYTVILVLVVVVLKQRQSRYAINRTALQKPEYSTDIPLKECPAYGELSAATPAGGSDEERVYEHPQ